MDEAAFEFRLPGSGGLEDELGLWMARLERVPSFALGEAEEAVESAAWFGARLPESREGVEEVTWAREQQVLRMERGLDWAAGRLESAVSRGDWSGAALAGEAAPEQSLWDWLWSARSAGSYALGDELPEGVQQAARAAAGLFEKAQSLLSLDVVVESAVGAKRAGLTILHPGGDAETVCAARGGIYTPSDRAAAHRRVLETTIRTRGAWLKMASLVVGGSLHIAALLPGGPGLAIPAVYRFFRQVLLQVQNWPESV